jgi:diguanylate cyclase (GGDEF)-like protein
MRISEQSARGKILVIDDEPQNVKILKDILSDEYKVLAVVDSRRAVETVENKMPDIILLDVVMPEMDGYEVIAALKSSERTRDIPVIFITGLERSEDEEKCLSIGAVDYISKPFSHTVVKLRVQNQMKIIEQFREIERLSMQDQLTKLPNRHSFEIRMNTEWGRTLRNKVPISLLLIDVDKFKNYNDTYGHQQGDIALKSLAKIFGLSFKRSTDFAARWGGEEFIVLLPETDAAGALEVAEQLRAGTEAMEIPCLEGVDKSAAKITISVGVNTQVNEYSTIDKLISDADVLLYQAKSNGRNRIMGI